MATEFGSFNSFLWNPYTRSFVGLTGTPVDTSALRATVGTIRRAASNRLAELSQQVLDGSLTNMAEFAIEFKSNLKSLYLATHVLSRGGVEQMTQSDWGKLGRALKAQYKYADAFVRDIENERIVMPVDQRIGLYTDSAWGAAGEFENVVRDREMKLGSLERRVLSEDPDVEHCEECIELAERDWQPPGLMKDIGDCECGPGCKCTYEFENTELDKLAQAFGGPTRPKWPASSHSQLDIRAELPDPMRPKPRQRDLFPDLIEKSLKGGAGSGNFGHSGRPGEVGGSSGASSGVFANKVFYHYTTSKLSESIHRTGLRLTEGSLGRAIYLTTDATGKDTGGNSLEVKLKVKVNVSNVLETSEEEFFTFWEDAIENSGNRDISLAEMLTKAGYDSLLVDYDKYSWLLVPDRQRVTVIAPKSS